MNDISDAKYVDLCENYVVVMVQYEWVVLKS